MTWLRWAVVVAAAAVLSVAAPAAAQSDGGRISGTVRDQLNGFVHGATVTARNEKTGETRTAETNDQGYFLIAPLKPSIYTVKAEKSGFARIEYTTMVLAVGQELALDFEARPAGVQEEVTVVGTAPILDMASARIGANVGQREVEGLPVNGRQMSQLMLQAPGSQNAGTGTWQDVRFSGRAVEQNAIRYDGIEGSAIVDSAPGNLNGEVATPFKLQASLENVQEFRIESNNYPAEYGTGTGGQVSVITKSGGNVVHGGLFEYLRNDAFDAPNFFDTAAGLPKSDLSQNQFGGSIGLPLVKNRAFAFLSYEGYRLNAGLNLVEATPSDAAWARAVPTIAQLRPGFLTAGAVLLPGKSQSPDFDIYQLQSPQVVREDSFSGRFDFRVSDRWSSYVRVFHDQGKSDQPDNIAGRVIHITDNPSNAVFNLQGVLSSSTTNEFKVGYNAAPTNILGLAPTVNGIDFSGLIINMTGSVANTGIAGQGATSGITVPGGLIRANSAQNGRAQPYDPYTLSFIDSLGWVRGSHYAKFGGELRMIRMATNRLGGTTYTYPTVAAFLANQPSQIQFLGDVSDPSVFNNGATGDRHTRQQYYIAYAQDEWRIRPNVTLNYGLRYDYYTVLREANDLEVKFNVDTGVIDPAGTPLYKSKKNNLQPRLSLTYSPASRTVLRAGGGIFVGPGQTEDQIQPVADSDRVSSTLSSGALLAFPIDPAVLRANFINNPSNRAFQPRAFANDYTIPERVYQYTASMQQEIGDRTVATIAYVGSQGRNLFLRSVTNQITGLLQPDQTKAATVVREFSIVNADGTVSNPFAEIDYKTSGGHDQYNSMQLSVTRRLAQGLTMNGQYTYGVSTGNTAGSNEALTVANNARKLADFEYDNGYNNFDVRHTYNLSALYSLPIGRGRRFMGDAGTLAEGILGGWDVGGIVNGRSGLPIDVRITRNDVVYVDAAGLVFNNAAAGRTAVVNTPGGGATRNVRRPNLIAGVDPFIHNGGTTFLNPAAFSTPAPGTFGNLERNSLHGPGFKQVDLVLTKHFPVARSRALEFRAEIFNLFNVDNFSNPSATLNSALPNTAADEANKVQPGQAYTAAAAGPTFGKVTATVGRTVGLGTNRQMQFALRFSF